jgi:hypothetical protein
VEDTSKNKPPFDSFIEVKTFQDQNGHDIKPGYLRVKKKTLSTYTDLSTGITGPTVPGIQTSDSCRI